MVNISDCFNEWKALDWIDLLVWENRDLFLSIGQSRSLVARNKRRVDATSQIFWENMHTADCLGCGNRSDDCDPASSWAHCNNNKNWWGLDQSDKHPDDEHGSITM